MSKMANWLGLLIVPALCGVSAGQDLHLVDLPQPETVAALAALKVEPGLRGEGTQSLAVEREALPLEVVAGLPVKQDGTVEMPFLYPNSVLVQFEPFATAKDIEAVIEKFQWSVRQTFPTLGIIRVEANLRPYYPPADLEAGANMAMLQGVYEAMKDYQSDELVASAAPDFIMRSQFSYVAGAAPRIVEVAGETVDWGIGDIQADQLWSSPQAGDGALFGIMDSGFARHDDLVFQGIPAHTNGHDHGNHVAGIACAIHNNGIGVAGVIPNCHLRVFSVRRLPIGTTQDPMAQFLVSFTDIIESAEAFARDQHDLRSLNVSLGYNWRANFAINPDVIEGERGVMLRALIESHGSMALALLRWAQQNDVVVFSAAGNDSNGDQERISALYASPFNWAATVGRTVGVMSGAIVEAHDQEGRRTAFSNAGGDLSCPGQDILSTVAYVNFQARRNAYGLLSGTSMAAPYCAAAHTLLSLVRPGRSALDLLDCMRSSPERTDHDVPMLKLTHALAHCP